jgi:hypothetical protein
MCYEGIIDDITRFFTLDSVMGLLSQENIVAFVNIVAGIGTAVSAFLGYQALTEVRKQRESSYKPEIVLSGGVFNIYNLPLTNIPFPPAIPWEYTYEDKGREYQVKPSRVTPLPVRIHNIGLGAAKNVKVSCDTDIEAWLGMFNNLSDLIDGELPFKIEYTFNNTVLSFKSAEFVGTGNRTLYLGKRDEVYTHILPISIENKPLEFILPYEIFYFLSAYTYLDFYTQVSGKKEKAGAGEKTHYKRPPLPDINFSISYLDIANKQISKRFIVRVKNIAQGVSLFPGSKSTLLIEEVTST